MIDELLKSDFASCFDLEIEDIAIEGDDCPCNKGGYFRLNIVAEGDHRGLFPGIPTDRGYASAVLAILRNLIAINPTFPSLYCSFPIQFRPRALMAFSLVLISDSQDVPCGTISTPPTPLNGEASSSATGNLPKALANTTSKVLRKLP